MSMNFYLKSPTEGELEQRYPDVAMRLNDMYPSLGDYFNDMSEAEHKESGHFYTQDKGWCKNESTVPTVNMSNSNFRYVLNEVLGLDTKEYCGDLEDLQLIRASLMLHSTPNCYYGITETLKLIELAIENDWSVYFA